MKLDEKSIKLFDNEKIDKRLFILVNKVCDIIDIELPNYSFRITEVLRTQEQQDYYFKIGTSKTKKGLHITGKAFDIYLTKVPNNNAKGNWNYEDYKKVADLFKKVALELEYKITWGGDWKSFIDAPHFQIEN